MESPDTIPAREGLPRNFRMRADRHYVDQLVASSADQPVRMLPLGDLTCEEADSESDVRPLIESIRAHGIVQPLIARRRESGFAVIAGRKRLRAARALRLAAVPCLIRELTDAEAVALAEADNVVIRPAGDTDDSSRRFAEARRLVAGHLANIRGCADMWTGEAGGLNRQAFDLLKAHACRAAALVQALDLIEQAPMVARRERSLSSVVDAVVDGFEAEARLAHVSLRTEIHEELSSSGLNEAEVRAGLAGALLATIPFAEHSPTQTAVIRVSSAAAGAVAFEVLLPGASVTRGVVVHFFDADLGDRPGGQAATIGALAAKALAERHEGAAKFEPFERGFRLMMTVTRRS